MDLESPASESHATHLPDRGRNLPHLNIEIIAASGRLPIRFGGGPGGGRLGRTRGTPPCPTGRRAAPPTDGKGWAPATM